MALPTQNRLRSSRDFTRVHREGKRAATRHLAIRALKRASAAEKQSKEKPRIKTHPVPRANRAKGSCHVIEGRLGDPPTQAEAKAGAGARTPAPAPRFGISISRKVSKRAVARNRIKRQLKAIIRRYLPQIAPGWQVAIVVRPAAVECEFDDFLRELEYLLKKLDIVT